MQNMFLNAKDGKLGDASPWQLLPFTAWVNGDGTNTFLALKKLCNEDPEELRKIFDYLAKARLYLEVTAGGKDYVLVHSGLKIFLRNGRCRIIRRMNWLQPGRSLKTGTTKTKQ